MKTYKEFSQQKIDEGLLGKLGGAALEHGGKAVAGAVGALTRALFSKAKKADETKSKGRMHGADKIT